MPTTDSLPEVELFTDGGCSATSKELEGSGGEVETTNNRMELTAVVRGLEALKKPSHVKLMTDSVYVGKGLSEWMAKWKANGWRRKEGNQWKEVKNEDLWRRLDELIARHKLTYIRVAGHSGHPENDRCDVLAVAAYQQFLKR
jgi:ribonuclease HI